MWGQGPAQRKNTFKKKKIKEISSREDTMTPRGEVQRTEEERIARAIEGKGEFLSEELKSS